jgi:hypothetical protein
MFICVPFVVLQKKVGGKKKKHVFVSFRVWIYVDLKGGISCFLYLIH